MNQLNAKEVLEVNHASKPTLLYQLLEERDWEGVKYQAENFEHEARTWVTKVDPTTKRIRWRVLPIHAALYGGVPAHVLVRIGQSGTVVRSSMSILFVTHFPVF